MEQSGRKYKGRLDDDRKRGRQVHAVTAGFLEIEDIPDRKDFTETNTRPAKFPLYCYALFASSGH